MTSPFGELKRYSYDDTNRENPFNTGEISLPVSWSSTSINVQSISTDEGRNFLLNYLLGAEGTIDGMTFDLPSINSSGVDSIHSSSVTEELFSETALSLNDFLDGNFETKQTTLGLTDSEVMQEFSKILKGIVALATPLTIRDDIDLDPLVAGNQTVDTTGGEQKVHPLSGLLDLDVVRSLDALMQSIDAAGLGSVRAEINTSSDPSFLPHDVNIVYQGAADTLTSQGFQDFKSALVTWRELPLTQEIFGNATSAAVEARVRDGSELPSAFGALGQQSLADIVRFEYVQRGHDLIFDAMSGIRDQLELVEASMDFLNGIQDVMNQKDSESAELDLVDLFESLNSLNNVAILNFKELSGVTGEIRGESIEDTENPKDEFAELYATKVAEWEAKQFDKELSPESRFTQNESGAYGTYNDEGEFVEFDLSTILEFVNTGEITGLDSNNILAVFSRNFPDFTGNEINASEINDAASDGGASLLSFLETKAEELLAKFSEFGLEDSPIFSKIEQVKVDIATSGSFTDYVEDFEAAGGEERGRNQAGLDAAFIAVQTQNDTQKEELRRRMFEFEEFIKSASSIILKLTQIIEKMAQGVRGV